MTNMQKAQRLEFLAQDAWSAPDEALLREAAALYEAAGADDPIQLIAAGKRLPVTADGVRIVAPMKVYLKDGSEHEVESVGICVDLAQPDAWGSGTMRPGRYFYSTLAAAEAAVRAVRGGGKN